MMLLDLVATVPLLENPLRSMLPILTALTYPVPGCQSP